MNARKLIITILCGTLLVVGLTGFSSQSSEPSVSVVSPDQIEGDTYRLERIYLVEVHIPNANVDKVLESLVTAVSLEYGKKYDQVVYISAPGFEQFRSKVNSKGGAQSTAVRDPSTKINFSVPHDIAVLQKAVTAIHKAHSYEEPVIYVKEGWRSRATKSDDKNPNRWWNRQKTNDN